MLPAGSQFRHLVTKLQICHLWVQRVVQSDDGSSCASNDGKKDVSSKKKVRSLVTTGGRKTPKDLFPDSPLTSTSEWPVEKDRCVFDFNHVQCPYVWREVHKEARQLIIIINGSNGRL